MDKTMIGDYLGDRKDFNLQVLDSYVKSLSFVGMTFDVALRLGAQSYFAVAGGYISKLLVLSTHIICLEKITENLWAKAFASQERPRRLTESWNVLLATIATQILAFLPTQVGTLDFILLFFFWIV